MARMAMFYNSTRSLRKLLLRSDATTHAAGCARSRALPSSLRPNLFSGD